MSRKDTPRDLPAAGDGALERARSLETLEAAYDAWLELRLAHGAARLRFQSERERLGQQGSFLVGAVRAAGLEPPGPEAGALVPAPGGARDFLREAEEKLARTREALDTEEAASEAHFQEAFAELRATLKARVQRYRSTAPPHLRLLLRKVGATRVILHVERVRADEAVLLLDLFVGRLPSRHGFLFDDTTEDVRLPPAPLYAEEGVAAADIRPDAQGLAVRVRAPGEVLPAKGFLPLFVPRPEGGEDFFRLLQRGPVMEVEVAEGQAFRNVLSREESERFAGYLLRLKLLGKLELEVEAG
jgi:hypothetical protein